MQTGQNHGRALLAFCLLFLEPTLSFLFFVLEKCVFGDYCSLILIIHYYDSLLIFIFIFMFLYMCVFLSLFLQC
jgi:hypothetical protein